MQQDTMQQDKMQHTIKQHTHTQLEKALGPHTQKTPRDHTHTTPPTLPASIALALAHHTPRLYWQRGLALHDTTRHNKTPHHTGAVFPRGVCLLRVSVLCLSEVRLSVSHCHAGASSEVNQDTPDSEEALSSEVKQDTTVFTVV